LSQKLKKIPKRLDVSLLLKDGQHEYV